MVSFQCLFFNYAQQPRSTTLGLPLWFTLSFSSSSSRVPTLMRLFDWYRSVTSFNVLDMFSEIVWWGQGSNHREVLNFTDVYGWCA